MIYFFGDTHGTFTHVRDITLRDRPAAIVLLGDMEARQPIVEEISTVLDAGIQVRWIRGNHDTDTKQNWDNLATAMDLNIDGVVVEIAGLRVAGLGGIFRREIWYPGRDSDDSEPNFNSYQSYAKAQNAKRPVRMRNETESQALQMSLEKFKDLSGGNARLIDELRFGKELKHLSSIFWDDVEKLKSQRADILVTHEAPSCHPHGFAVIDELAKAMRVKTVFHGHHHDCLNYRPEFPRLGFSVFGVGLCGVTDQDGRVVLQGLDDAALMYRQ